MVENPYPVLVTICAKCGSENPRRANFCLECGAALAQGQPAPEARKTVTVVFADVTGSTALGERLDAEALRRILNRYFAAMKAVLERHGARVEKFIGDAVVAVFGVPTVHEDDALRAVRAAVEMREALAGLNEELEREQGVALQARVGVNTGEVVAGDPTRGYAYASGDAVNVAARLEQAADPGGILVGEETFRLVQHAVTAERREPLALRGKGAPVAAFRLLDVAPDALARPSRFLSEMIGRKEELALLRQAFERASRDRTCQFVTVLGSSGVGKSRLVAEFLATLGEGATVLRGRCLPYGEGITFWPVAEVVREAVGIAGDETPASAQAKVRALVAGEERGETIAARVAEAIGLAEGPSESEETLWAIRRWLEALARRRPLVVVFDDLQWGEPTFLALVEHVADWSRGAPLLLLCMARPELLDAQPQWAGGKLNATSLLLEPLTDADCGRLIDNLLGEAPEEARRRIVEAAGGNPLFAEEMVAMLLDEGILEREDGRWKARAALGEISAPPTIQALLAARLDQLPDDEREILCHASVEGRIFHGGAVEALVPDALRSKVGSRLMSLVRKELIRSDRSAFAGDEAFRFRHLLIRDAAYEAMPKGSRSASHERFARWLEARAGERASEYEEILGYHLEQAYRYSEAVGVKGERTRELAREAGERLATAGGRAAVRGDAAAAARLLERALELLPPGASARPKLLFELGASLHWLLDFERADGVLAEAIAAARAAGDRRVEWRAILEHSDLKTKTEPEGSAEEAHANAERALAVFAELGDEAGLSHAWRTLVITFNMWGRAGDMERAARRALEHARRAGDERGEADSRGWICAALQNGWTPLPTVIVEREQALEWVRARGMLFSEPFALGAVMEMHAATGDFAAARVAETRLRAITDELGLRQLPFIDWEVGHVAVLAGDVTKAEERFRAAYDQFARRGDRSWLSTLTAELADVLYAQGRHDEAWALTRESEEKAASDDAVSQIVWRRVRAKVLARRGELDEAEALAGEAVALAEAIDCPEWRADAHMDLAEVLLLAGRPEDAIGHVQEALGLYERKGNVVFAGRARKRLNELGTLTRTP